MNENKIYIDEVINFIFLNVKTFYWRKDNLKTIQFL